jgi:hypothetical protein
MTMTRRRKLIEDPRGPLARISHGDSCIGWANQRKLFCNKQLI